MMKINLAPFLVTSVLYMKKGRNEWKSWWWLSQPFEPKRNLI